MTYEDFIFVNDVNKKKNLTKLRITDETVKIDATTVTLSNGTTCDINTLILNISSGKGCLSNPSKLQNWDWKNRPKSKVSEQDYLELKDLKNVSDIKSELDRIITYLTEQNEICINLFTKMKKLLVPIASKYGFTSYDFICKYCLIQSEDVKYLKLPTMHNSESDEDVVVYLCINNTVDYHAYSWLWGETISKDITLKEYADLSFRSYNKQYLKEFIIDYRKGIYKQAYDKLIKNLTYLADEKTVIEIIRNKKEEKKMSEITADEKEWNW